MRRDDAWRTDSDVNELNPAQRLRRSRIQITLFFVAIVALTMALTYGLAPQIQKLEAANPDQIPQWTCIEVVSGDTIRMEKDEMSMLVHLAGVGCPPAERGPELDAAGRLLNIPENEMLEKARIARNSLYTWINRRSARIEVVEDMEAAEPDATDAYVWISGVDVGKKVLQNGQAYALDTPHPLREDYLRYEEQAREREIGFWRVP